jgi:dolichol-phosphate mannosyltransferase
MSSLRHFFGFAAVGALGTIVNTIILFILHEYVGLYYLAASIFAIEISIIHNFLLNEYFVFGAHQLYRVRSRYMRFLRFNIACAGGVVINLVILAALVEIFYVWYIIANIIAIGIAFISNFVLSKSGVWKNSQ